MKDNKRNGFDLSSGSRSGGTGATPPQKFPKHKRLLAALVAEKTVDRLGLLSPGDLWLLADEIFKQDQDLCRRMAYALGRRVCDSCEPPRDEL
jgi:hypothetical protein